MSNAFSKRPDEVLDYTADFTRWLSAGDSIASATATITSLPTTGTAAIASVDHDDKTATAWVSGGIDGETADVVIQIVTAQGRTKDFCFRLRIKDAC